MSCNVFGNVKHNLAKPEALAELSKVTSYPRLRYQAHLSESYLLGFLLRLWVGPRNPLFYADIISLMIMVLATREEFLGPTGYCTVINYGLDLQNTCFGLCSNSLSLNTRLRLCCSFIYAIFKAHTKEVRHNLLAHHWPRYYRPQQVLVTV